MKNGEVKERKLIFGHSSFDCLIFGLHPWTYSFLLTPLKSLKECTEMMDRKKLPLINYYNFKLYTFDPNFLLSSFWALILPHCLWSSDLLFRFEYIICFYLHEYPFWTFTYRECNLTEFTKAFNLTPSTLITLITPNTQTLKNPLGFAWHTQLCGVPKSHTICSRIFTTITRIHLKIGQRSGKLQNTQKFLIPAGYR